MKTACRLLFVIGVFCAVFLFYSACSVVASAPIITASPSSALSLDSGFSLSATMSGLSKNATYRLRIALAQSGTTNYFGSTYDGSNWHDGSITDGNYIAVTTDNSGAWWGDMQGKVDSEDPNFTTGSGSYDLKIGRYTQTGTSATWSDPVQVSIAVPPTNTPTPTNSPTLTQSPTNTPRPTLTIVPTSTSIPTKIIISNILSPTIATSSADILAASDEAIFDVLSPTPAPSKILQQKKQSSFPWFFTLGGVIFLLACGIFGFQRWKKWKRDNIRSDSFY